MASLSRSLPASDAGSISGLAEGDILLTLNDRLITKVRDLDVMYSHDTLNAVIVRKQQQIALKIPTIPSCKLETDHVVVFCGAILQRPHHAVRQQTIQVHSTVTSKLP